MVLLNKMVFSNIQNYNFNNTNSNTTSSISNRQPVTIAALNSSMINRVHKAKSGCSACGKKVA
uniref:Uncharacterized protein n=1 Tax=viral metagenome TaxID=1070528 RepID=A0A6C0I9J4_9ZZZZ